MSNAGAVCSDLHYRSAIHGHDPACSCHVPDCNALILGTEQEVQRWPLLLDRDLQKKLPVEGLSDVVIGVVAGILKVSLVRRSVCDDDVVTPQPVLVDELIEVGVRCARLNP